MVGVCLSVFFSSNYLSIFPDWIIGLGLIAGNRNLDLGFRSFGFFLIGFVVVFGVLGLKKKRWIGENFGL